MKNIQMSLIGFGKDVVIKGDEWYILSIDTNMGLYCYSGIMRNGVDHDGNEAKVKIIGVDVDGY